jgi:hypothetical protein
MSREPSKGERKARDEASAGEPAVREHLEKIQRDKRARVRWQLSRHTAELALEAIHDLAPCKPHRPSSKSRRRKRHKRLL